MYFYSRWRNRADRTGKGAAQLPFDLFRGKYAGDAHRSGGFVCGSAVGILGGPSRLL